MSTFEIIWLEGKTTSTGKEKYDVVLKDIDSGTETKNVTIWSDFQGFNDLTSGSTVYGSLVPARDPKYGPTLYPLRPASNGTPQGRITRNTGITAAMEKKSESVNKAMDRKDESIKISATLRDAVLITTSKGIQGWNNEDIEAEIDYWRKWLWKHFDDPQEYPPF